MDYYLRDLEVHMIVATPYKTLPHITPNKKYVVVKVEQDIVWIHNDYDELKPYKSMHFAEADVYFALCLYMTFVRILGLTNKPLDSLKK